MIVGSKLYAAFHGFLGMEPARGMGRILFVHVTLPRSRCPSKLLRTGGVQKKNRKRRKSGTVGNSAENFDGVVTRSTQFVQHEQTFTATTKLLGPRTTMTNVPVARQLSENFPSACSFC